MEMHRDSPSTSCRVVCAIRVRALEAKYARLYAQHCPPHPVARQEGSCMPRMQFHPPHQPRQRVAVGQSAPPQRNAASPSGAARPLRSIVSLYPSPRVVISVSHLAKTLNTTLIKAATHPAQKPRQEQTESYPALWSPFPLPPQRTILGLCKAAMFEGESGRRGECGCEEGGWRALLRWRASERLRTPQCIALTE